MKIRAHLSLAGALLCGFLSAGAQPTIPTDNPPPAGALPAPTPVDQAWEALLQAKKDAEQSSEPLPVEAAARQQARARRAAQDLSIADQAKAFYTANPDYYWAAEARRLEILSLIQAEQSGEAAAGGRLAQAVASLRTDRKLPARIRAHGAAAYEFTRAVRGQPSEAARQDALEKTARTLIQEFPAETPGYEALLALSKAAEPAKAEALARELAAADVPAPIRTSAQTLLDRYALVGRRFAEILPASANELKTSLPEGQPIIVYSWATWGPGSIELGRMIQARRFAALGICLDDDLDAARRLQHEAGLGGQHVYDEKGRAGEIATPLRFSTAGQIYLVDAQGVIRDVRGGQDLEAKLAALGFQTPAINPPSPR
jgi:hypothetical protein